MLDSRFEDADADQIDYQTLTLFDDDTDDEETEATPTDQPLRTEAAFAARAAEVYDLYATRFRRRFRWLRADLFNQRLPKDLRQDAENLQLILQECGNWEPQQDAQLNALVTLLTETYPHDKLLIFSQFADTVHYLERELHKRQIRSMAGVTGSTADPTQIAWRFSPHSNGKREEIPPEAELRVLIATDVLSEGQNLQDAHIVVNYDLPWAIIRLIQRAGRVDRIGQQSPDIYCYSIWPAAGVERIIRLRERLRNRLQQNAEVVGTDEAFFEDDLDNQPLINLYHEMAGVLDEEPDGDIDLVSHAYQIWKNATDANPQLQREIEKLPSVVYSAKAHTPSVENGPYGALLYLRTALGNSALVWVDQHGHSVTESQFAVLRAAQCTLDTPPLPRLEQHHELVTQGVQYAVSERITLGGQLGRPSGVRFKTYERLKAHAGVLANSLFAHEAEPLQKALDEIYRYPLQEGAKNTLNRQLRSNIDDDQLRTLVINLHQEGRLCLVQDAEPSDEPQIICSLGLVPNAA
ncbi:MAG: SWF/SNF helicase family protein [Anaerolineales bacterium]|nr:SWF/SNF helicase family protein [Anaerolineales bacterium]